MGNHHSKKKRNSILTEQALNSLIANTSFTRKEILQWHEGFLVILQFLIPFIIVFIKIILIELLNVD
jgi:hypothetical protein